MKKEEMTIKNTKAELLDALNEALEREKNLMKAKSDPIKEEKQKVVEKAIETSRVNVEQNIFSEELNKKFKDLELAIKSEEDKLKELYGVSKELNNLTLVINASKDYQIELEKKKEEETKKVQEEINALENQYKAKKEELEKEYDLMSKNLKLARDREVEEYNYKLKRDRELENNKWEDEKRIRLVKIKEQEEETKKLLDDAKAKTEEFNSLAKQVADIPLIMDKEYNRGKKEITNELEKDHKHEIELLNKDSKNVIDRQTDKITSLETEITRLTNLNTSLQEKMDKAYLELKELATKTVETNGSVKILNNNEPKVN